jgi:starch-binding outer membrane protein, SusD/RagB family
VNSYKDVTGTYYYPFKYKSSVLNSPVTEYLMMMRLGEQYLIRAEARVQKNDFVGAKADINIIRKRAGLANTSANDKSSLLAAVLHERQVELFSEWGHRWFDLKRTGAADSVMSIVTPQKGGGVWKAYQKYYPIPLSEIQSNPNLNQNLGY